MSDLVIIEENKACTTSLAIADGTNNEHRAVLQLISRHIKRFEQFGTLEYDSAFEMRNSKRSKQGRPTRVAVLNESQATLLMTGQMGLLQKHAILTLALGDEKDIASSCGKGLSDWKRKRDGLQYAIREVERQIQPQLTNFE